jgi:hypothetical protein
MLILAIYPGYSFRRGPTTCTDLWKQGLMQYHVLASCEVATSHQKLIHSKPTSTRVSWIAFELASAQRLSYLVIMNHFTRYQPSVYLSTSSHPHNSLQLVHINRLIPKSLVTDVLAAHQRNTTYMRLPINLGIGPTYKLYNS